MCLCAAVTICSTLVNKQTDRQKTNRQTQTDTQRTFDQLIQIAQPAELKCDRKADRKKTIIAYFSKYILIICVTSYCYKLYDDDDDDDDDTIVVVLFVHILLIFLCLHRSIVARYQLSICD